MCLLKIVVDDDDDDDDIYIYIYTLFPLLRFTFLEISIVLDLPKKTLSVSRSQ